MTVNLFHDSTHFHLYSLTCSCSAASLPAQNGVPGLVSVVQLSLRPPASVGAVNTLAPAGGK